MYVGISEENIIRVSRGYTALSISIKKKSVLFFFFLTLDTVVNIICVFVFKPNNPLKN